MQRAFGRADTTEYEATGPLTATPIIQARQLKQTPEQPDAALVDAGIHQRRN
jgi:hypothetical protein